ncbi:YadA-like family protein [Acinetobacter sp. AS167]|uniref:YadA-like family protein n=1 Tax=Acinetobacter sp. AS167 TaxID=3127884 RepID=UPI003017B340
MNKVYKVIWHATLGAWVAVSETTKGRTKSKTKAIIGGALVMSTVFGGNTYAAKSALPETTTSTGVVEPSNVCLTQSNDPGVATDSEWVCMGQTATGGIALINGVTANPLDAGTYNLDSNSSGKNAVAIGSLSTIAAAENSIALGNGANANQKNSVAIGNAATVDYRSGSIAIGDNAQVILGSHVNDVNGKTGSISIGLNSRSIGGSETVIGAYAGTDAQRFDDGARNVYGSDSVLIGSQAGRNSQYLYATYVGDEAGRNSIGDHNTYVGQNAARWRTGGSNVALGSNALIGTSDSTNLYGNYNTALGTAAGASLEGNFNTAVGHYAAYNLKGNSNTVTGNFAADRLKGNSNTFNGNSAGSTVEGNNNVGVGQLALGFTNGDENVAVGYQAGISTRGSNNIMLGANSGTDYALTDYSVMIGSNSTATQNFAVAIGASSEVSKENAVALGSNSNTASDATTETNAVLNGLTYGLFAGQVTDKGMQVSVGSIGAERQIKNVGSGAISETSTDAINGSQLYATNAILGNVGNDVTNILGGNAVLNQNGSISYTNIGGTGKNTVDEAIEASRTEVAGGTNVAGIVKSTGTNGQDIYTVNAKGSTTSAGSSAVTVTAGSADSNNVTDYAVDLSQSTKDSLVKADTALQSVVTQIDGVDVKNVNKDDNKVNFVTGDNVELKANADGSIQIGTAADVNFTTVNTTNLSVTGETKLGDSFTVNNGGSYYSGPISEATHIVNKNYVDTTAASSKTEVDQGKNIQISSTTGADGQTIYTVATADDVDFNKVSVGDTTITSNGLVITNGPSITKNGISAGDQKITDVAEGVISADSKEAINGSQLYSLGSNLTQIFGGNALYENNQISWSNIGDTGQNNIDDAIKYVNDKAANANQGWKVTTDSGSNATSTVKPSDTVNINGDTVSGVTVKNTGNNITVGLSDQIQVGSGSKAVSIDGNAGTIQVGDVHIDGAKGNITAGQVTVNGEAGTVNGLTNTTWNPNNIVSGQAATEDQLKQVVQDATQAATAAKSTVTAGDNIAVSTSKNADGSTNYQVATQKDVSFDTVKSGLVTSDKITVGNVVIDQAGINAGENKVTNVANGTISSTSTDAINGSQLHSSNTNIYNYLGGGANYETNTGPTYNVGSGSYNNVGDALNSLDQSVTNVSNRLEQAFYTTNKRIDDVENRANAGNAQALATAGLPQAYIPGKSMMAISGGTFRGESGYAIGMSSISDTGRWVFKISGSGNSRGDFGGTIGTGIQW